MGRHEQAANYLGRCADMDVYLSPTALAATLVNLSAVLSCLDRHQEALDRASYAIDLLKNEPPDVSAWTLAAAYHNVAVECEALGRVEQCIWAYQRAYEQAIFSIGNHDPRTSRPLGIWWAFDLTANWMNLNYQNMSDMYVKPAFKKWQSRVLREILRHPETATATRLQEDVVKAWWDLYSLLVVRYNDGFFNFPEESPDKVQTIGYPEVFLREIGFNQDFIRPKYVMSEEDCNYEKYASHRDKSDLSASVSDNLAFLYGVSGLFAGFFLAQAYRLWCVNCFNNSWRDDPLMYKVYHRC
jgi:hypothetical protein